MIRTIYFVLPKYKSLYRDRTFYSPELLFFSRKEALDKLKEINKGRNNYFIEEIKINAKNRKILNCSHTILLSKGGQI